MKQIILCDHFQEHVLCCVVFPCYEIEIPIVNTEWHGGMILCLRCGYVSKD